MDTAFLFLPSCRPSFAHLSPIHVTKVPGDVVTQCSSFVVFGISIPMYNVASSCWCPKVSDNVSGDALTICARVPPFSPLSVVVLITFVLLIHVFDLVRVCRAGYVIYTDGVFDSVLRDLDDFRPDTYN